MTYITQIIKARHYSMLSILETTRDIRGYYRPLLIETCGLAVELCRRQ